MTPVPVCQQNPKASVNTPPRRSSFICDWWAFVFFSALRAILRSVPLVIQIGSGDCCATIDVTVSPAARAMLKLEPLGVVLKNRDSSRCVAVWLGGGPRPLGLGVAARAGKRGGD